MRRKIVSIILIAAVALAVQAKTLGVYYSYTNNVHNIISIQNLEKGLYIINGKKVYLND